MTAVPRRLSSALAAGLLLALVAGCASIRSGVQAAYNDDLVGRMADPLSDGTWVPPEAPDVAYTGRHTVLVFFDPGAAGTPEGLAGLRALHAEFAPTGVAFFGITDADAERLVFLTDDHPIPFPVLTEAAEDRRRFRIKKLYEPEVLLVDPYGRVLEDGLADVRKELRAKR